MSTLAWAGFWAWFVVAVVVSEARHGVHGGIPVAGAWLAALSALLVAVWRWPKVGGLAMIVAGIGAAVYFNNSGAQLLLALPAVAIGGLALAAAYAGRMPR
jgi:hypothetical protein